MINLESSGASNGRVSIIIPTLNEEKIIEKTLRSLASLSSVSYEVIVSDGGSKDRTVEIAKKYAHMVVGHSGDFRQNIAEGRNLGAEKATGEYLVFIDADVHIPHINSFFEHALFLFKNQSNLEGLTVFLKVLPEHVTLSDRLFFGLVNRLNQIQNNVLHIGSAAGEFQMVRAETFKKLGGYNSKIVVGEDNDLFSRLSKVGRTRVESGLHIMHTSRRAHEIGWYKLLFLWLVNLVFIKLLKRSFSKVWHPIR